MKNVGRIKVDEVYGDFYFFCIDGSMNYVFCPRNGVRYGCEDIPSIFIFNREPFLYHSAGRKNVRFVLANLRELGTTACHFHLMSSQTRGNLHFRNT